MRRPPHSAERLLPGCGPEEEPCITEAPGLNAVVTFKGIEVTARKIRLWHVEAAGMSASAEFLDQALELVLPRLSYEDLESLSIRLLSEAATRNDGSGGGEI